MLKMFVTWMNDDGVYVTKEFSVVEEAVSYMRQLAEELIDFKFEAR